MRGFDSRLRLLKEELKDDLYDAMEQIIERLSEKSTEDRDKILTTLSNFDVRIKKLEKSSKN